jgi:hypothetical protein
MHAIICAGLLPWKIYITPVVVVRQTALGSNVAEYFLSEIPVSPAVLALFHFTGVFPYGTEI